MLPYLSPGSWNTYSCSSDALKSDSQSTKYSKCSSAEAIFSFAVLGGEGLHSWSRESKMTAVREAWVIQQHPLPKTALLFQCGKELN